MFRQVCVQVCVRELSLNVFEALDAEYLTFGFSVLCFTTGWATMASYVASGQIVNKNRTSE